MKKASTPATAAVINATPIANGRGASSRAGARGNARLRNANSVTTLSRFPSVSAPKPLLAFFRPCLRTNTSARTATSSKCSSGSPIRRRPSARSAVLLPSRPCCIRCRSTSAVPVSIRLTTGAASRRRIRRKKRRPPLRPTQRTNRRNRRKPPRLPKRLSARPGVADEATGAEESGSRPRRLWRRRSGDHADHGVVVLGGDDVRRSRRVLISAESTVQRV